ncbi:hypothetical protein D9M72_515370 [compost metagenome]
MTHHAITQAHYEGERLASVLLHEAENTGPNTFELDEGEHTDVAQIKKLLADRDRVHVFKTIAPGEYAKADEVRLRSGTDELISLSFAMREQLALKNLPQY